MAYPCLSFNQDFSCLCAGSDTSLRIYNVDPFGECFELGEGASVAQMLFSTSLVTVVGAGTGKPSQSTRRLRILNTKKKATICELTFPTAVLSVKLNRKRLVVVLVDQIYVYDISCMKLLHTIETSPNELALCDLSSSDDSILLYPAPGPSVASPFDTLPPLPNASSNATVTSTSSNITTVSSSGTRDAKKGSETGTVVLFDALNIAPLNIIKAHKTELAVMALNSTGTLLATASNKGTIIRVFNTLSGTRVAEFRRGSYSAQIHSLTFDTGSNLLAAASETETIHIFKLDTTATASATSITATSTSPHAALPEDTITGSDNEYDYESDEREERILPRASSVSSSSDPISTNPSQKRQASITDKLLQNLPRNITSMLEPQRHFASVKLHHSSSTSSSSASGSTKTRHTIGFNGKHVIIASTDGSVNVYEVPMKGGECVLMKQYSLD
ncbi:Autophagy-related protein 18 [Cyberlindnera fabianii]|uniref:Autophagy-related protein 18 n=1 Tax=Cyberlindnera fabianii TaxID=36022 RepID=A0A1V2L3G2_CYBFA|nr:Autophagy-related protein 18 [Cyberlindnera fabianii]